jgi:hypothetical protein
MPAMLLREQGTRRGLCKMFALKALQQGKDCLLYVGFSRLGASPISIEMSLGAGRKAGMIARELGRLACALILEKAPTAGSVVGIE